MYSELFYSDQFLHVFVMLILAELISWTPDRYCATPAVVFSFLFTNFFPFLVQYSGCGARGAVFRDARGAGARGARGVCGAVFRDTGINLTIRKLSSAQ